MNNTQIMIKKIKCFHCNQIFDVQAGEPLLQFGKAINELITSIVKDGNLYWVYANSRDSGPLMIIHENELLP